MAEALNYAILTNGTPEILVAACAITRIEKLLDFIISIEEIVISKSHGRVYELVNTKMGLKYGKLCLSPPMHGILRKHLNSVLQRPGLIEIRNQLNACSENQIENCPT